MLPSTSRHIRRVLLAAVIALAAGLLGPMGAAVAADAPVTLTASITGTPTVGKTLTAAAGSLSPDTADLTYQWQTTEPATDIAGATSSTFTPTADQIGKQVQVVISGTAGGRDPGSATSAATSTVQGVFSSPPVVRLTWSYASVGESMSAVIEHLSLPFADSYTLQWYADGIAISGATGGDYVTTPDDVGKVFVAKATAVKANYDSSSGIGTSEMSSPVTKADFTPGPTAFISRTPKVGQELTAISLGEYPAADAYEYYWIADDDYIAGATNDKYTLTAAEHGKTVKVHVVAKKAGYNDALFRTYPTDPVGAGTFTGAPAVNLSTTGPKVGDALKATPTGGSPTADSYSYQWYRISALGVKSPIVGAVDSTYNVPTGALNYKLQAKVTAVKAGYNNRSSSSVQTARVNMITLSKTTVARGSTIVVTARHLRAGQVFRIFVDGVTVYKGTVPSNGMVARTVTVPRSIGTGSTPFRVSGYTKAGARDFTVVTNIPVT